MKVLKWIWQFPQNFIGFLMSRKPKEVKEYKDVKVYYTQNVLGCGASLGDFIILDISYLGASYEETTIKHEYGHHRQSIYLGWLYLLAVGLPSACRNRWDVLFHKNWEPKKAEAWYYGSYPENWADRLGGVKRNLQD